MKQINSRDMAGIIKTDTVTISFTVENFQFIFVKTDSLNEKTIIHVDESGYIWGTTYSRKNIAIYAREDIEVQDVRILKTWNYIISKTYIAKKHMRLFDGIRFENGVVRTIYPCNALHKDFEKTKDNTLVYYIEKDSKEFYFQQNEQEILWNFHSAVNQKMSIDEGISLSNSNSILDIIFDKEQNYTVFSNHYRYVYDFCSFLTFRTNISFEKVQLFYIGPNKRREVFSECFVKNPDTLSQRKFQNIISVRSLNDKVFNNIMLNILKTDKKHKGLPLSIISKDDLDVKIMDIGKIRNICSVLEMELDLEGVRLTNDAGMKELIDSVKYIVKKHRKGSNALSEKTYNKIFGSITHWSQPLAERAWAAWTQHMEEVKPMLQKYDLSITQDSIEDFVKARNNITHNGLTGISDEVSLTAFVLMGLIYCCTLSRLGMDPEEIKCIIDRNLIG